MAKIITADGEIVDENCEDCVIGTVPPFWKTPYNHDTMSESNRTALTCPEDSLTDQSFKEDADINTIMERVKQGAQIPVPLPEHFGDAFSIPTLLEARTRIAENNATFYNLPPNIRAEFLNDPARWEDHVHRQLVDQNFDEVERLGIDLTDLRAKREATQKQVEEAQASADEKQLQELSEKLAKRSQSAQGASPAPGNPGGAGAATKPPPTSKD